jgi:hypothetical protein
MFDDHHVRFELTGELALAGVFLMTHWPNPDTTPELEPSARSLGFVVDTRGSCLDELRHTLRLVGRCKRALGASDGSLLVSAEAWSKEIERRCPQNAADLLQPAGDTRQGGSRRSQNEELST